MVDGSVIFDFDEGSRGTAHIFEEKSLVFKFNFGMVATDAFVEDQNVVRTVPAYFGPFLFD